MGEAMPRPIMAPRSAALAGVAILLSAPPAAAQVEELVVTARERAENIQNIPWAFDLNVRLPSRDAKWEIALIGKNLTNALVVNDVGDLTNSGARTGLPTGLQADIRGAMSDPRTVALQFTLRR
jgi:hypothetical protein